MKTDLLTKWERPNCYVGPNYDGYFVGPSRNRDSDIIDESNFEAALERLGGETPCECNPAERWESNCTCAVRVIHDSHWACGWVEYILVRETATEKVATLAEIQSDLDAYPILDETDVSERQIQEADSAWDNWGSRDLHDMVSRELNDTEFFREHEEMLGSAWRDYYYCNSCESAVHDMESLYAALRGVADKEYTALADKIKRLYRERSGK